MATLWHQYGITLGKAREGCGYCLGRAWEGSYQEKGMKIWPRWAVCTPLSGRESGLLYYIRCTKTTISSFNEKFSPCKSASCKKFEKYLKKVLASSEKGSTFAPAFGTEERTKRGEHGSEKVL